MPYGRPWEPGDIYLLYGYAEKISQHEAAKRLNRTYEALIQKVAQLGIRWRQGYTNFARISREIGCSPQTVKRTAEILYPDGIPSYGKPGTTSYRPLIDFDMEARIVKVILANRERRKNKIKAGKMRHQPNRGKTWRQRQQEKKERRQSMKTGQ